MSVSIRTARLALVPVAAGDAGAVAKLPGMPNDARALVEDSLDVSSSTSVWRIADAEHDCIGVIAVRSPSVASLRLRAIGWRSLELVVALEETHRGRGYAQEAIETIAAHLRADPVIFALVALVDEANMAAHRLLQRCAFEVLGHAQEASGTITVYERAL